MTLPVPNLDDRSFQELLNEAKSLIPIYNSDWTNHNPSDPGITLLELFAWLTEMTIYRMNQIPEESYRRFLKLIGIDYLFSWDLIPGSDSESLRRFLVQNYRMDWVKEAEITKEEGSDTIRLAKNGNLLTLRMNSDRDKMSLTLSSGETYHFPVRREIDYAFHWERIPGNENYRMLDYLNQNFGLNWAGAVFSKSEDQSRITISHGLDSIYLRIAADRNTVDLELDIGNWFQFSLLQEKEPWFEWSKVPGEHDRLILKRLAKLFGLSWKSIPRITKSSNGKMITIRDSEITVLLHIHEDKDRVTLTIAGEEGFEFQALHDLSAIFEEEPTWSEIKTRLVNFMISQYGLYWVRDAVIKKSGNGEQIVISYLNYKIRIQHLAESKEALLAFKVGNSFELHLIEDPEYLFNWEEVGVEKDRKKLINHLIRNFAETDWLSRAGFKVINNNILELSDDTRKVILVKSDGSDLVTGEFQPHNTYRFHIKRKLVNFFDWERFGDVEQERLRTYLIKRYGLPWLATAEIIKDNNKQIITIKDRNPGNPNGMVLIRLGYDGDLVHLQFNTGNSYSFKLRKDEGRLQVYQDLEHDIRRGLESVTSRYRAITTGDFEFLAGECMEKLRPGMSGRAICIQNRNLEFGDPASEKVGHVSVIILPRFLGPEFSWDISLIEERERLLDFLFRVYQWNWLKNNPRVEKNSVNGNEIIAVTSESNTIELKLDLDRKRIFMHSSDYRVYELPIRIKGKEILGYGFCVKDGRPTDLLKELVLEYLDRRRLITTRAHVVAPQFQEAQLSVRLVLKKNFAEVKVQSAVKTELRQYFSPFTGGRDGKGWVTGKGIYRSEVYRLLEQIPGVDYVAELSINGDSECEVFPISPGSLIELDTTVTVEERYHGQ